MKLRSAASSGSSTRSTAPSVASFGYAFDSYVNLDSTLTDRFAVDPESGSVFTIDRGSQVFADDGGTLRYVPTVPTLITLLVVLSRDVGWGVMR